MLNKRTLGRAEIEQGRKRLAELRAQMVAEKWALHDRVQTRTVPHLGLMFIGPHTSTPAVLYARDEGIAYARERGQTFRVISQRFGIAASRVPQVLIKRERYLRRESAALAPGLQVLKGML